MHGGWKKGLAAVIAALLTACGGGDPSIPPTAAVPLSAAAPASCAIADQRAWLRSYLHDWYYWNGQLAQPDENAKDMDAYFRSMLPASERFSYTQAATDFGQFFDEGTRTGYGYTLVWDGEDQTILRVRQVEPRSPAARAGLRRGEQIVEIDGFTPAQVIGGALPRVTGPGVPRRFTVADLAGTVRQFTVASAVFPLEPVPVAEVLQLKPEFGGAKVAYMAYNEFIIPSETALDRSFSAFARSGATELVLDLRYNGGGSVVLARGLASMIGGKRLEEKTFAELRFNANRADVGFEIPFTTNIGILPGPVLEGLRRVVIITSASTASASELVINALRPFIPVVLIGETTYGKPYGFVPREACGTVYNAVAFESLNALGQGGFTGGFAPTCAVADDLTHELGEPAERRLATALHYLVNGSCPAVAEAPPLPRAKAGGRSLVLGEQPAPHLHWRPKP